MIEITLNYIILEYSLSYTPGSIRATSLLHYHGYWELTKDNKNHWLNVLAVIKETKIEFDKIFKRFK